MKTQLPGYPRSASKAMKQKTKQSWAATPGNATTDGECMPLGPKKCVLTMASYATVCRFAGRTQYYWTKYSRDCGWPKYWGGNYFAHGRFPKVGQKQKTEKKKKREKERKKERKRERLNDGDNNGQATHGARKHAWRTQAAWAN